MAIMFEGRIMVGVGSSDGGSILVGVPARGSLGRHQRSVEQDRCGARDI